MKGRPIKKHTRGKKRENQARPAYKYPIGDIVPFVEFALNRMDTHFYLVDENGCILYANDSACQALGYSREELLYKRVGNVDPEYQETAWHVFVEHVKKSGAFRIETTHFTKGGKPFPVLLTGIYAMREHGNYILAFAIDISERKYHEQRIDELNNELSHRILQLEASNRELESFAYAVSHDMTAPLRSIIGFTQVITEDCRDKIDDKCRDYLTRIHAAGNRMAQQMEDMLMLSRVIRKEINMQKVDLSRIASEFADELKQSQPKRRVDFSIEEGIILEGDKPLMEEVMRNLLRNAWKFTGKHDHAMIEVGSNVIGKEITYYVKDDGAGFDMKYADKLFLPFQRLHTKDEFPGNGIGLATVYRIIQRHGGRIWAEAAVEKGAAFYFTVKTKQGNLYDRKIHTGC